MQSYVWDFGPYCIGKKIMLLGVNFDFHTGNITDWIKKEI